ncbi:MAG: hypothetical protein ABH885_00005, partial [Candidatus Omnitrophota bacterium]
AGPEIGPAAPAATKEPGVTKPVEERARPSAPRAPTRRPKRGKGGEEGSVLIEALCGVAVLSGILPFLLRPENLIQGLILIFGTYAVANFVFKRLFKSFYHEGVFAYVSGFMSIVVMLAVLGLGRGDFDKSKTTDYLWRNTNAIVLLNTTTEVPGVRMIVIPRREGGYTFSIPSGSDLTDDQLKREFLRDSLPEYTGPPLGELQKAIEMSAWEEGRFVEIDCTRGDQRIRMIVRESAQDPGYVIELPEGVELTGEEAEGFINGYLAHGEHIDEVKDFLGFVSEHSQWQRARTFRTEFKHDGAPLRLTVRETADGYETTVINTDTNAAVTLADDVIRRRLREYAATGRHDPEVARVIRFMMARGEAVSTGVVLTAKNALVETLQERGRVDAAMGRLVNERGSLTRARRANRERIAELDQQIEALGRQRDQLTAQIDNTLRPGYISAMEDAGEEAYRICRATARLLLGAEYDEDAQEDAAVEMLLALIHESDGFSRDTGVNRAVGIGSMERDTVATMINVAGQNAMYRRMLAYAAGMTWEGIRGLNADERAELVRTNDGVATILGLIHYRYYRGATRRPPAREPIRDMNLTAHENDWFAYYNLGSAVNRTTRIGEYRASLTGMKGNAIPHELTSRRARHAIEAATATEEERLIRQIVTTPEQIKAILDNLVYTIPAWKTILNFVMSFAALVGTLFVALRKKKEEVDGGRIVGAATRRGPGPGMREFVKLRKVQAAPERVDLSAPGEDEGVRAAQAENLAKGIARANRILSGPFEGIAPGISSGNVTVFKNMRELAAFESDGIQIDISALGDRAALFGEDGSINGSAMIGSQMAVALSVYHEKMHEILKKHRAREAISDEEMFGEEVFVVSKVLEYLFSANVTAGERNAYFSFLKKNPSINNAQFSHLTREYRTQLTDADRANPARLAPRLAAYVKKAYARDWTRPAIDAATGEEVVGADGNIVEAPVLRGRAFDLRYSDVKEAVTLNYIRNQVAMIASRYGEIQLPMSEGLKGLNAAIEAIKGRTEISVSEYRRTQSAIAYLKTGIKVLDTLGRELSGLGSAAGSLPEFQGVNTEISELGLNVTRGVQQAEEAMKGVTIEKAPVAPEEQIVKPEVPVPVVPFKAKVNKYVIGFGIAAV